MKDNREICQAYRNVFAGKEGPKVLADMLTNLGVFTDFPVMTPEIAARKDYGARLLMILGGGQVQSEAIIALINRVSAQPLPKIKEEDEEN